MERGTSTPATPPIRIAAAGATKAHPQLLATSPPTQPFAHKEASGLPKRLRVTAAVTKAAAEALSSVLTPISGTRSIPAPEKRIAPAQFRPVHPASTSRQAKRTKTELCPGIATGIPPGAYLPRRGPRIQVIASAVSPPTA